MTGNIYISCTFLIHNSSLCWNNTLSLITKKNPQQAWRKACQRVQSLTQYNVQKEEGGREATGTLLRDLAQPF